jgi:hypothetical protein
VGDHRAGRDSRDGDVVNAVTRWFSIDEDGQPELPGYYDVAYGFQRDENDSAGYDRRYWSGAIWQEYEDGKRLSFGNEDTAGERWRGLAEKPA